MADETVNSCFNCRHLHKEIESWEMPHVFWYECGVRPQNAMLRQFPFRKTKCDRWEQSQRPKFLERLLEP